MMIEDADYIIERVDRLIAGTETAEDRQEIAAYIRGVEERIEFVIEMLSFSRDRFLKKAAAFGDVEAQEWLADRERDEAAYNAHEAELREWRDEESEGE